MAIFVGTGEVLQKKISLFEKDILYIGENIQIINFDAIFGHTFFNKFFNKISTQYSTFYTVKVLPLLILFYSELMHKTTDFALRKWNKRSFLTQNYRNILDWHFNKFYPQILTFLFSIIKTTFFYSDINLPKSLKIKTMNVCKEMFYKDWSKRRFLDKKTYSLSYFYLL